MTSSIERDEWADPTAEELLPLVRMDMRWWARGWLLAVHDDGLLIGRVVGGLDEDDFGDRGLTALSKRCRSSWTVAFDDVDRITLCELPKDAGWSVYVRAAGRAATFRFAVDDIANLWMVLAAALGDRVVVERGRWDVQSTMAVWIAVVAGFALTTFLLSVVSELWATLFGFLGGLVLVALAIQRGLAAIWRAGSQLRVPKRLVPRPAKPLHSPAAGIACKVVAVAWVAFVLEGGVLRILGLPDVTVVYLMLVVPGLIALQVGHRLGLRPLRSDAMTEDVPPVLLLRSFKDDDLVSLQPSGFLGYLEGSRAWRRTRRVNVDALSRWTGDLTFLNPIRMMRLVGNTPMDTAEQVLAAFCRCLGPLIAVGRPGEILAPSGAERTYLQGDQWRDFVREQAARARAVVLQPGASPGVWWEMEECFAKVEPQRLLLSLANFVAAPGAYEVLAVRLRRALGITLPRCVPFHRDPCFVRFDDSRRAVLLPLVYRPGWARALRGDATDLPTTLRGFTARLQGLPTPTRTERRRRSILDSLVSAILANLVGLVLAFALISGLRLVGLGLGGTGVARLDSADLGDMTQRVCELQHGVATLSIGSRWSMSWPDASQAMFVLPRTFVNLRSAQGSFDLDTLVEQMIESVRRDTDAPDVVAVEPLAPRRHGMQLWYEATLELTPPDSPKIRHRVAVRRHASGSLLANGSWDASDDAAGRAVLAAIASLRFTSAPMDRLQSSPLADHDGKAVRWRLRVPSAMVLDDGEPGTTSFSDQACSTWATVSEMRAESEVVDPHGFASARLRAYLAQETAADPQARGVVLDATAVTVDGREFCRFEIEVRGSSGFSLWTLGLVGQVGDHTVLVEVAQVAEDSAHRDFLRAIIGSFRITG